MATFVAECARCGGAYAVTARVCPGARVTASVREVAEGKRPPGRLSRLLTRRGGDARRAHVKRRRMS